jgi:hypothetical protein
MKIAKAPFGNKIINYKILARNKKATTAWVCGFFAISQKNLLF